jgi:hypothetical protein
MQVDTDQITNKTARAEKEKTAGSCCQSQAAGGSGGILYGRDLFRDVL